MKVLEQSFERPAGFDLQEHLRARTEQEATTRIVIQFTEKAYRWARRSVPADIEVEEQVGDDTRVTFYFSNLEYVANWLLRYGKDAEVIEPQALKDELRAEALALAQLYEGVEA